MPRLLRPLLALFAFALALNASAFAWSASATPGSALVRSADELGYCTKFY